MININNNEVHLWFAHDEEINDEKLLKLYHEILNTEELSIQSKFIKKKHRHQYLITRSLVRNVLSYYVNNRVKPHQWHFHKNNYGKPVIANPGFSGLLDFNLSHSENIVVLAVTGGQDVGVDVEYIQDGGKALRLADEYFSCKEVDSLLLLPKELREDRFFDLWTLKEAYTKACGKGLSIPLDQFSFSFVEHDHISISFDTERNDNPDFWQFWNTPFNSTHRVSVAIKKGDINNHYYLTRISSFSCMADFSC